MSALLDKLRGFFATNSNWSILTSGKKKFSFPSSIKTDEDPSETWEIIGDIGDGAFGKIFKVQNKESGIFSALKQVNVDDESDLGQYSVEVVILSELKHPNVVGMHEAFYYDSKFWMYLEYCSVGAVDNIIHDLEHGLSEPQIQTIAKQMCIGLKFLHDNGVIHRDLKAGNVLITSGGIVKLADFGVSAKCSSAESKRNTFIGTPYWMAPEVITCETTKDSPYDFRADIWSFGITIIEFAQMDPPYNKMNPARVAIKIMRSDPPTLDQPKKWSSDMNDFIAKCLQKDPSDRLLMSQLLQHAFLRNIEGNIPIIQLISEVKADVTIELCDVDSQDDLSSLSNSAEEFVASSSSSVNSPSSEKASLQSNKTTKSPDRNSSAKGTASAGSSNGHVVKTTGIHSVEPNEDFSKNKNISSKKNSSRPAGVKTTTVDEEIQELSLSIQDDEEENAEHRPSSVDVRGWPANGFHGGKFGAKPSQRLLVQSGAVGGYHDYFVAQSPGGGTDLEAGFDRQNGCYRSLTKTRSYVYEGNVITHRTSKIVVSGDENRQQEEHQTRKANFRALKLLQFTENRRLELLNQKFLIQKDTLDRQFQQEIKESLKRYNADCEHLMKSQKQEIERLEAKHSAGHRNLCRTTKEQQEKDFRAFQDNLKRELRIAKRESSAVPKNIQRRQLELKEVEFAESERKYREHQSEMLAKALERLSAKQRKEMAALESSLLEEKHQLLRGYECELWRLEEKRLDQKTEVQQLQITQLFELHKELATFRHLQELEQVKRSHDQDSMKLRQKIMADNKEAARKQKLQNRREQQRLREAFRGSAFSSEQERDSLKELEEKARKRIQEETEKQDAKNRHTLDVFERDHSTYVAELKQLFNDRLEEMEEQFKMRMRDENERHRSELMEWHFNLSSRKQSLEDEFTWQVAEQRRFYSDVGASNASSCVLPSAKQTSSSWMNSDNHISTAL